MTKCLLALLLAIGVAGAQNPPAPQTPAQAQTPAQKETKRRLALLATRAIANFRSADSIEASLSAHGQSLHPQLVTLRLRIEAALDEAQGDVDQGDLKSAKEDLDTAQALLDRYIQRLGGA